MLYLGEFFAALVGFFTFWANRILSQLRSMNRSERILLFGSLLLTLGSCVFVGRVVASYRFSIDLPLAAADDPPNPVEIDPEPEPVPQPQPEPPNYRMPVADAPPPFPLNKRWPTPTESQSSWNIDTVDFDPSRDLVRIEDPRVWWESDNDDATGDTEDDHLMHWAMEDAFRRLIELVDQEGGGIKVQDVYRAEGVHHAKSLHKQGRAMDLTSQDPSRVSLGKLASLCVAAGFDWVYFERKGGLHIHASVNLEDKVRRQ